MRFVMPHASPEKRREYQRAYMRERRKNQSQKEYDSSAYRRYRENNKDKIQESLKIWKQNNPEKWKIIKRRAERRRHEQIKSSRHNPDENSKIESFYKLRDWLTEITGIEHHVDHIVPLSKGGTHTSDNLQVLKAKDNLKKGSSCGA